MTLNKIGSVKMRRCRRPVVDANDSKLLYFSHFCVPWLQYPKSTQLEPKPITKNIKNEVEVKFLCPLLKKGSTPDQGVFEIGRKLIAHGCVWVSIKALGEYLKYYTTRIVAREDRFYSLGTLYLIVRTSTHARERTRKACKRTVN